MEKQYIYIATDKEDGSPVCSSPTREGLQTALNEYNGCGTHPNVTISKQHIYEYKYGGETLMEYISYHDTSIPIEDDYETTFYIWCIEFNN